MNATTILVIIGGIALIILASIWLGGAVVLGLVRAFVKTVRWIVEPITNRKKKGGDA